MRELKFRVYDSDADVWVKNVSDFTVESLNDRCPSYHKVMQYTGLKDINGKDIFEGDITEVTNGYIGKVLFSYGSWVVDVYGRLHDQRDVKIIGNIHENKELIKGIK